MRPNQPTRLQTQPITLIEVMASLVVLVILVIYQYGFLAVVPYLGVVDLYTSDVIEQVFHQALPGKDLQQGDKILKIGDVSWKDYFEGRLISPLFNAQVGDTFHLTVERRGEILSIDWTIPDPTTAEISFRLINYQFFFLPVSFWLAGTLASFLVRPRTTTRRLLIAFLYFSAVWLAAGVVSSHQIYGSYFVFHWALWVSIPILWHLHWVFPAQMTRISPVFWTFFYLAAFTIGVIDGLKLLPYNGFSVAGLLLALGALVILLAHLVVQPKQRRPVTALLIGFTAAVAPSVIYSSLLLTGINPPAWMIYPTFLSLVFIPLIYIFVFTYRRWGIMEMRANRIAAIVVYGILIFLGSYLLMMAWSAGTHTILVPFLAIVVTTIICGVITALIFPAYQRWFERRILGIPAPPQGLLVTYADRILTSLDAERLVHLIRDEAFPSLLIRQAALLRIQDAAPPEGINAYNEIFRMNLAHSELPNADELAAIYSHSGQFISPGKGNTIGGISWLRLALPLEVSGKLLGLCLFGKRDPDDYYAATEITVLQALMDQTAMALVNIEQNQLLHNLYQDDIQRQERERSRLALELHDDVLGHLAIMAQADSDHSESQTFLNAYQASVHSIRQIISGLRPPMLDYGLRPALEGLMDEIAALTNNRSQLKLELPASSERFPDTVELHLYRIIQQACRNAVRSGGAHQVIISGIIDTGLVEIHIEDDGSGFDHRGALDLHSLMQNKHFGLAGMYERCALIGAHLKVESSPGSGTHIWLSWQDD